MPLAFDFSAMRATLANRNFAVFTAGSGVSLIGSWVQRVAVGWLTWELTHSAAWLGIVAMAEFLPVIFLAPLTGVMADRFDRRRITIVGQVLATTQAVALAAFTLTGHITPLLILLLQIAAGLVHPLIQTARLVIVPSLLPREHLGQAVVISSLTFNAARIIGPAIAGPLIAGVGAGWAFALNSLTYVFAIVSIVWLVLPAHQPRAPLQMPLLHLFWNDFINGWRYTFAHPTLQWVLPVIFVTAMMTWPISDLLAGITESQFDRGVGAFAVFASAQGIGAILGGLFLAQRKGLADSQAMFVRTTILNGAFVIAFALTDIYWLAVPLYATHGMFMVMCGATSQTVVQTAVSEDMRGRTISIWYTLTRVGLAAGALILGTLANMFGFAGPLCAAGLITAVTAAVIWRRRGSQTEA
jgi:MFS family permease